MEDAAGLDAHGAGQVAHRRAFVTLAAEQVGGGLQQLAPRTVRVGDLAAGHQFAHHRLGFFVVKAHWNPRCA
ncbi:hypothetical protein D3C71_1767160 [compost metagenome]